MYVCLRVHVRVYVCLRVYERVYICVCLLMYARVYVCVCVCIYARVRIRTVELHTIMFRHPTDDQLLICLLFQQHHSSVYAV